MSYIQNQTAVSGWSDWVDKAKDIGGKVGDALVAGVKQQYMPKPPPAAPAKEPTFMDKYGGLVVVGGLAVVGVVAYKALKK